MNCLDKEIAWNKSFFNLHDSSLGRKYRVTQNLRNSRVLYHKTKNPFEAKICMKIFFSCSKASWK